MLVPITAEMPGEPVERPLRYRRDFVVARGLESARLRTTALGISTVEINGAVVGDHVLAPGWTSYKSRLPVAAFDVTALLREGENAIGSTVAEGWYRGRVGFEGGRREIYGDEIGPVIELTLEYADGSAETVSTDRSWRASTGPVRFASLYDGEHHDARIEDRGWSSTGFDDSTWMAVRELAPVDDVAVELSWPPVRRIEQLGAVEIFTSPSGATLVDFGQNISGRVRLRVSGPAGAEITIRHAEVLEAGELGVRPLRGAAATDRYVLSGEGIEEWEPSFTIHGFRYAQIDGWPGELSGEDIRAVVCHSDLRPLGTFHCSDDRLNKLHDNVRWSMRGNFVSIPTDCPQRDERLGWTGDLQVFMPTASFLYDCRDFIRSWFDDLTNEFERFGTVPMFVPWIELGMPAMPIAGWGDAATVVPWVLYERYGDLELLRRQYPTMRRWVEHVAEIAGSNHLWNSGFHFGDWLDPTSPPDKPYLSRTDRYLVATACHARSARLVAHAARELGEDSDREQFERLADDIATAFRAEFVTSNGRLACESQTAYALALEFDLLETESQRRRARRRLAELVLTDEFRIGTGFLGTPLICDALSSGGDVDAAYALLMQQECPSWLYPVTMGATTMWERWDSMLPDGSINPGEMTSFNHYAFGAIGDFMHRVVAGLAPASPGYRRIRFCPRPGGGLTSAAASHESPLGLASIDWQILDGRFDIEVLVPPGASAVVVLPDQTSFDVEQGRHSFSIDLNNVTPAK